MEPVRAFCCASLFGISWPNGFTTAALASQNTRLPHLSLLFHLIWGEEQGHVGDDILDNTICGEKSADGTQSYWSPWSSSHGTSTKRKHT
jgi:hypothetical protein